MSLLQYFISSRDDLTIGTSEISCPGRPHRTNPLESFRLPTLSASDRVWLTLVGLCAGSGARKHLEFKANLAYINSSDNTPSTDSRAPTINIIAVEDTERDRTIDSNSPVSSSGIVKVGASNQEPFLNQHSPVITSRMIPIALTNQKPVCNEYIPFISDQIVTHADSNQEHVISEDNSMIASLAQPSQQTDLKDYAKPSTDTVHPLWRERFLESDQVIERLSRNYSFAPPAFEDVMWCEPVYKHESLIKQSIAKTFPNSSSGLTQGKKSDDSVDKNIKLQKEAVDTESPSAKAEPKKLVRRNIHDHQLPDNYTRTIPPTTNPAFAPEDCFPICATAASKSKYKRPQTTRELFGDAALARTEDTDANITKGPGEKLEKCEIKECCSSDQELCHRFKWGINDDNRFAHQYTNTIAATQREKSAEIERSRPVTIVNKGIPVEPRQRSETVSTFSLLSPDTLVRTYRETGGNENNDPVSPATAYDRLCSNKRQVTQRTVTGQPQNTREQLQPIAEEVQPACEQATHTKEQQLQPIKYEAQPVYERVTPAREQFIEYQPEVDVSAAAKHPVLTTDATQSAPIASDINRTSPKQHSFNLTGNEIDALTRQQRAKYREDRWEYMSNRVKIPKHWEKVTENPLPLKWTDDLATIERFYLARYGNICYHITNPFANTVGGQCREYYNEKFQVGKMFSGILPHLDLALVQRKVDAANARAKAAGIAPLEFDSKRVRVTDMDGGVLYIPQQAPIQRRSPPVGALSVAAPPVAKPPLATRSDSRDSGSSNSGSNKSAAVKVGYKSTSTAGIRVWNHLDLEAKLRRQEAERNPSRPYHTGRVAALIKLRHTSVENSMQSSPQSSTKTSPQSSARSSPKRGKAQHQLQVTTPQPQTITPQLEEVARRLQEIARHQEVARRPQVVACKPQAVAPLPKAVAVVAAEVKDWREAARQAINGAKEDGAAFDSDDEFI